jgi:hypothetical protein
MTVESTLADRTPKYGDFKEMSRVAQVIKYQIRAAGRWITMTPSMHEALDMIALKLARIACGDPTVIDSWHDIAGYATLIERQLQSGRADLSQQQDTVQVLVGGGLRGFKEHE